MASPLLNKSKKELLELARKKGVRKPEALSREELVKVLGKPATTPLATVNKAKPAPSKPVPKPVKPAAKLTVKPKPKPKPAASPAPAASPSPNRLKPTPATTTPTATSTKPTAKSTTATPASAPAKAGAKTVATPAKKLDPVIAPDKDLSTKNKTGPVKDQIWLMVSDPFWLHACWELSQQAVQRAEAAFGQDWYGAKPVIRVFDVTSQDTTSTSETPVRDIVLQPGCNHWYIDVPQPPRTYRVDIGYLSR
ncbi:MAG: DUF4912 domain-containing protein, partial [Gemmataceae bacterium]